MENTLVNVVSLKMTKDKELRNKYGKINTPEIAYNLLRGLMEDSDKEMFVVMSLDNQNRPTNISVISIGTATSALADVREVYKYALMSNANKIILAHNHPSGSLEPSKDDLEITQRLVVAGQLLNISINDHIIISESGCYSMRRNNSDIFEIKSKAEKYIFKGTTR